MKYILTKRAPSAIGPYSQAILAGNILFVSGQLGMENTNNQLLSGITLQTEKALQNLNEIITEAGFSITDIMKTTIFLKDINSFQEVNSIYSDFFKDHKPARSTVEVNALPRSALIEIEAIAIKLS